MKSKAIFICGTDTGAGKTIVTGLLAGHLSNKGYDVVTQKWAETGACGAAADVDIHLRFMAKCRSDFGDYISSIMPYAFKFPSSPHLAAKAAGRNISIRRIESSLKILSENFDLVLVEGTGGLFVPLNTKTLFVDIIKKLDLPVLVVAANKLGAINHTLLTIEALKARRIRNLGIIFNDVSKNEERAILNDNPAVVNIFTSGSVLGRLPNTHDMRILQKAFSPIGKKIESWING